MSHDFEQLSFDLQSYVKELFKAKRDRDRLLEKARETRTAIEYKYAPRAKFERWRDSIDGKRWKKSQHTKQRGQCAICQTPIALNGSHIDHIQPLSRSPQLACTPHNLQILCATCNQRKGNR